MENNELQKAQSSLDFENEELDIFKQDVAEKILLKISYQQKLTKMRK